VKKKGGNVIRLLLLFYLLEAKRRGDTSQIATRYGTGEWVPVPATKRKGKKGEKRGG